MSKSNWRPLYAANRKTIGKNPNLIKAGEKLKMPDGSTHVVAKGENLTRIANGASKAKPKVAPAAQPRPVAGRPGRPAPSRPHSKPVARPVRNGPLPVKRGAPSRPSGTPGATFNRLPIAKPGAKAPPAGDITKGGHYGFHDPLRKPTPPVKQGGGHIGSFKPGSGTAPAPVPAVVRGRLPQPPRKR